MNDPVLKSVLKSGVEAMGFEFVGYEYNSSDRHALLRVFVDVPMSVAGSGINIADISKISKHLAAVLDVAEVIKGRYGLEVSSPGIERPLFELAHYQRYIGKTIKVRLYSAVKEHKNFTARLDKIEENETLIFVLEDKDTVEELVVPLHSIRKANVVIDI